MYNKQQQIKVYKKQYSKGFNQFNFTFYYFINLLFVVVISIIFVAN
jgi:hypothetical protein